MAKRKPRKARPREKNVPKGYDSKWEYKLHQGVLSTWQHHEGLIRYTIPHKYYPDFVKINDNTYEVCGLASAEVLNKYQDASLIKDKRMIERKTGFVGYDHLIPAEFINEYIDCIYG